MKLNWEKFKEKFDFSIGSIALSGNILIVFANIPLLYLGSAYVFKATKHYKKDDKTPFTSEIIGTQCQYWDERANSKK